MNGECTVGVENRQRIIALEKRTDTIDEENDKQWTSINEAREKFEEALREVSGRLPNWAVAGFSGAGVIIGILTTLLVT